MICGYAFLFFRVKTKTLIYLLFALMVTPAKAQDPSHLRNSSLVQAELDFIRMAAEKNTRDAFLAFLADDAVTFGPQGVRIGKEHLRKQKADSSWLWWTPVFTDIASDGSFGFNTGPWEYRVNRQDEKPVATGHFVTVWEKTGAE